MVVIKMDISKYSIEYPEGKPWEYKVFRNGEDVTKQFANNLIADLVISLDANSLCKENK